MKSIQTLENREDYLIQVMNRKIHQVEQLSYALSLFVFMKDKFQESSLCIR